LRLHGLKGVELTLDLGLARGIAYYTGIVFEFRHPGSPGGLSLGGGGRYDGLVKALGSDEDVPALGFAWTVERVAAALGPNAALQRRLRRVLVVPQSAEAYASALRVAATLRLGGEAAEVAAEGTSLSRSRQSARARGMQAVVMVEADGSSRREPL
jgi:histidyl-tRNA synthetase